MMRGGLIALLVLAPAVASAQSSVWRVGYQTDGAVHAQVALGVLQAANALQVTVQRDPTLDAADSAEALTQCASANPGAVCMSVRAPAPEADQVALGIAYAFGEQRGELSESASLATLTAMVDALLRQAHTAASSPPAPAVAEGGDEAVAPAGDGAFTEVPVADDEGATGSEPTATESAFADSGQDPAAEEPATETEQDNSDWSVGDEWDQVTEEATSTEGNEGGGPLVLLITGAGAFIAFYVVAAALGAGWSDTYPNASRDAYIPWAGPWMVPRHLPDNVLEEDPWDEIAYLVGTLQLISTGLMVGGAIWTILAVAAGSDLASAEPPIQFALTPTEGGAQLSGVLRW